MVMNFFFCFLLCTLTKADNATTNSANSSDYNSKNNNNQPLLLKPYLVQLDTQEIAPQTFEPKQRAGMQIQADMYGANLVDTLQSHAKDSQSKVLKFLEEQKATGDVDYIKSYYISNTIAVTCTEKVKEKLSKLSGILEIIPNNKVNINTFGSGGINRVVEANVDWKGDQKHWSLDFINSTNLDPHIYDTAAKLVYANADSGVDYQHPALYKNYLGVKSNGSIVHDFSWWDGNKLERFGKPNTNCGINSKKPCWDDEHGTHTMSTTVGLLGLGVSPTTKWIACKNMDNNIGSPESYLSCLQFFLAPTDLEGRNPNPQLRPHVVGNSYGCPADEGCTTTTFKYALQILNKAGVFMSVSAGNDGAKSCGSIDSAPAMDPSSFNVAASKYRSFERAYFSSVGPVKDRKLAVDVTAPGVNITGATPGGKYASFQGTSMASPHVSGAALLIMAGCPHLYRQVDKVAELIRKSSTPVYPVLKCGKDKEKSVPNNEYGYGIINVKRAIEMCSESKEEDVASSSK